MPKDGSKTCALSQYGNCGYRCIVNKNLTFLTISAIAVVALVIMLSQKSEKTDIRVFLYWKDDPSLLDFSTIDEFEKRGVKAIYLAGITEDLPGDPNYDKLAKFVGQAKSRGIETIAMCMEDPLFIFDDESALRSKLGSIIETTGHLFDAYVTDIEPHTINDIYSDKFPNWHASEENQSMYLVRYVKMSAILADEAHSRGKLYADTIPFWYHNKTKTLTPYANGLDSYEADFLNVLVYTDNAQDFDKEFRQIVDDTSITKVPVVNFKPTDADLYVPNPQEAQKIYNVAGKIISENKKEIPAIGIFENRYFLINTPE